MEKLKMRYKFIDNLRSFIIILVITMHTAVTYSGFGSWYYVEGSPQNLNIPETIFFGFLQSFLQAWFMGALFFISAFLCTKSVTRHGPSKFIRERFFRLGVPLLIYMLIIAPFIIFVLLNENSMNSIWHNYKEFIFSFWWLSSTGPLWFVETLLIFCVIYIAVKKLGPKQIVIETITRKNIVTVIVLTGVIAFLVRLVLPIGTDLLNLQFCYFPSYIALFFAGIVIGENNLLEHITEEKNIFWLKLSFMIGIPVWCLIMIFGGPLNGEMYINGGLNWQSFAFAMWESFIAIGFSIGILALFKKILNTENKFTRLFVENAFGIYVFHAPLLISISLLLKNLVMNMIAKFAIVALIACIVCLLFSIMIRKIKPLKILFK